MQGREIKFRVWDKAKCRWSTMEELLCEIPVSATVNAPSILKCGGDDYDIQMFTGLRDKHGKEIYEGDFFKMENDLGVVRYRNGRFYVDWSPPVTFGLHGYLWLVHDMGEVIDNIYESPELLEVGK